MKLAVLGVHLVVSFYLCRSVLLLVSFVFVLLSSTLLSLGAPNKYTESYSDYEPPAIVWLVSSQFF